MKNTSKLLSSFSMKSRSLEMAVNDCFSYDKQKVMYAMLLNSPDPVVNGTYFLYMVTT